MHVGRGYFVYHFWYFESACNQDQSYVVEMKLNRIRSQNHMDLASTQTTLKLPTLN